MDSSESIKMQRLVFEDNNKIFHRCGQHKAEIEAFIDFIERTCPVKDTIANTPAFDTELIIE